MSRGGLEAALNDAWKSAHDLSPRLREPLATVGGLDLPAVFAGEIFAVEAVRTLFSMHRGQPAIDCDLRSIAMAMRSGAVLVPSGALRVNAWRGETAELLAHAHLPAPGESCQLDNRLPARR